MKKFISSLLLVISCSSMAWQPTKEVQLVVPLPVGGPADSVARIIASGMIQQGTPTIVVNRPGAGGAIGTNSVINSPPNGHIMLLTGTYFMFNKVIKNPAADYDLLKSLTHVSQIGTVAIRVYASTLAVKESFPTVMKNTLEGRHTYSWGTTFSGAEFIAQVMAEAAGNNMKIVTYNGSTQAHTDLMGGHIDFVIDTANGATALAGVMSGKSTAVATANQRNSTEITLDQFIPGLVANSWFGISLPANTDPAIVNYHKQLLTKVLADPEIKHKLNSSGVDTELSNLNFAQLIEQEYKKYYSIYERNKK